MRLTPEEVAAIKAAAAEAFGQGAVVRLFGSRVDDMRRGGDIDLHVEIEDDERPWKLKTRFEEALFRRMDEQRVDIIFSRPGQERMAIEDIAYRDGVVL